MIGPRQRQRVALLLLAAAALAAFASAGPAPDASDAPSAPVPARTEPAARPVERNVAATAAAVLDGIEDAGRAFQVLPLPEAPDAFQPRSWQPPAPPPPKPAPPAKPVAPPLPFAYLGRIEEGGATTVYLRRGEDVVLAQAQQAIDPAYRLEEISADRLVFTYVPLQQQQVLSLGAVR